MMEKKLNLRRIDVVESGIPGYVIASAYSTDHARRLLERYFVDVYGLSKEDAKYLAGRAIIGPIKEDITEKEAQEQIQRMFDEYGVMLDVENRSFIVDAKDEAEASKRLKRYLVEEWAYTKEEANEIAKDIKEKK
jgi:hypothetical protein